MKLRLPPPSPTGTSSSSTAGVGKIPADEHGRRRAVHVALYLPAQKLLATGDVLSGPVPYFTPPLGQHARSLRTLRALEPAIIVPGHGPVRKDTSDLDRELGLFDSIVSQVKAATERGLITVDEVRNAVDVESLRPGFSQGDPALDEKFRRYVSRMVENAYREARDDKFWTE